MSAITINTDNKRTATKHSLRSIPSGLTTNPAAVLYEHSTPVEQLAITAVDPGSTTGCARGVVTLGGSIWDALKDIRIESWEITGDVREQAWEIMGEFADWVVEQFPIRTILVCESFVLRKFTSGPSLLDPVRIAAGMEVLALRREGGRWAEIGYQSPSDAKSFATDARLRSCEQWVRGSEHRRDAVRHVALAAARSGPQTGAGWAGAPARKRISIGP